ncbi:hypothetical protein ACFQ0B_70100 [Nonomuraea thailandensis]
MWALAAGLRETARVILAGDADDVVAEEAAAALRLPPGTALRYLGRLKDPDEGLVADGRADAASLSTVLGLRRRHGTAPDPDHDQDHDHDHDLIIRSLLAGGPPDGGPLDRGGR